MMLYLKKNIFHEVFFYIFRARSSVSQWCSFHFPRVPSLPIGADYAYSFSGSFGRRGATRVDRVIFNQKTSCFLNYLLNK